MQLGLGLGLTARRASGGATPSLSDQIEALLLGTSGFALDPTDTATMWQENTKATQVSGAGQTVGAIRTKWGAAQFDFLQATGAARPTWDGTRYVTFDGVDDYMDADGAFTITNNVPGFYAAWKHNSYVSGFIMILSTGSATTIRISSQDASASRLRTQIRRLDGDSVTDNLGFSAEMAGSTVALAQDFATTGTGEKFKDNVSTGTYALGGAVANSQNTSTAKIRLGSRLGSPLFFMNGKLGRMVCLPFVPSAGQRTTIQSWLTEV